MGITDREVPVSSCIAAGPARLRARLATSAAETEAGPPATQAFGQAVQQTAEWIDRSAATRAER